MTIPVPVDAIAEDRGVTVARNHAVGNDVAGFALRQGSHRIVGVNTACSPRRQRFAIARGLGHLELHDQALITWYGVQVGERRGSVATVKEAREATVYAADLLMPRDLLAEALQMELDAGHDSRDALIGALAARFQVSVEAMGRRLISLGMTMA